MTEQQINDRQIITGLIAAKFDYEDACEKKSQAEQTLLAAKQKALKLIDFEGGQKFLICNIDGKNWLLDSDPELDPKYTDIFPVTTI